MKKNYSKKDLARWWCQLNGWEFPQDLPEELKCIGTRAVFNALPERAIIQGFKLWKKRIKEGVDPSTGKKF